jgi:hypothetical protein
MRGLLNISRQVRCNLGPNPSLNRTPAGGLSPARRSPEIAAIWVAVATALVLGLAGCAAEPGPKPSSSPLEAAPYVGVFTGEFVDGKPLYRLPSILVIGSRSSVGPDI